MKIFVLLFLFFFGVQSVSAQYYNNRRQRPLASQQIQAPATEKKKLTLEETIDEFLDKNEEVLGIDGLQKALLRNELLAFAAKRQEIIAGGEAIEEKKAMIENETEKFENGLRGVLTEEQITTLRDLRTKGSSKTKRKKRKKKKKDKG
ncbi:hypothetical protein [Spongiivirga citrea]|uniref:DUF4890 domain-containing protein n=1 Tax=Spongiivirga citrea TaxID=1481457 RepID=A0A6M0CKZ9_9FLAO|nr:hypothetical protein [Spongiivirga citrea]NER16664.1 hypothetical protein [Spongiivirga citrea]